MKFWKAYLTYSSIQHSNIRMICLHDLIRDIFYRNFIASSSLIPCLNTQRRLQTFLFLIRVLNLMWWHLFNFIDAKNLFCVMMQQPLWEEWQKIKTMNFVCFTQTISFLLSSLSRLKMIYVFVIKLRVSSYEEFVQLHCTYIWLR